MWTVFVPGNCTGELQPLDVSGNAVFKQALRNKFHNWYADQMARALEEDEDPKLDMRMSVLNALHASWLLSAVDDLKGCKDELIRGWEQTSIKAAMDEVQEIEVTHLRLTLPIDTWNKDV